MMLTEAQEKKKAKVEALGQVFLPPSQYREMMKNSAKPKYSKSAVKVNPHQVASYSARKAYKKDFKEISPDTDQLIDQILNPEDCNETIRWPNTYGLSATYKSKNILNARFSDDNRCCVIVNPRLKDSIYTTSGVATSMTLGPYSTASNPYSVQEIQLLSTTARVNHSAPIILPGREALYAVPNAQLGKLLYQINFTAVGAGSGAIRLSVRFPNALSDQAIVRVYCYDSSMNQIATSNSSIGAVVSPTGLGVDLNIVPFANFAATRYISWQYEGNTLPYIGPVYAFLNNNDTVGNRPTWIVPNSAQHTNIFDVRDADTIVSSADQAFVLAQSLLITAEMSDLNNGGVLAIARVPGSAVVGENDDSSDFNTWYDWIASLPYNAYDGAVKNGGYSWYLPEDETGFFYRALDTYVQKPLPYLVSEFTASDVTEASVVRIKVCTIVQFTTTASIYECRPSCHVSEMDFMHQILSLIQASYSNDGHKEGLKRILKKVGGQVVKLLKNPKTYATVAELLGGLAI